MAKFVLKATAFVMIIFILDRIIKSFFLSGFEWHGEVFSLYLVINKGVAFSMFAFLGEWLKFIQIAIILLLLVFIYREKSFFERHAVAVGILFGAGCSNVLDRFLYGGVVDYFAWHYWFNFAVFNFADVMIDLAVVMIAVKMIFERQDKAIKAK
ncbi:MAG: signal peptidase II [Campylobacteraceae bacterium]|jgi:signal peptidase II|nr:signal peptidase II [Campylobacteraceae bacterium]